MSEEPLSQLITSGTPSDVVVRYHTLVDRARDTVFGFDEDEVVVLDTETTGVNPAHDEIIEIAAAILKGPEVIATYDSFVNPGRHIPDEIAQLTGIDDGMVCDAPYITTVLREVAAFVGSRNIVAHSAPFDEAFVMKDARPGEFPGTWLDSLELVRIALPRLHSHNLGQLSEAFGVHRATHRAIDDVLALCVVWRIALVALTDFPPGYVAWLSRLRPNTSWNLRPIMAHIAAGLPDADFSLRVCRNERVTKTTGRDKDDAFECVGDYPTKRAVSEAFAQDAVVGAMYPDYELRSEQVVMAEEITEAFATNTSRAIEAGTGVGKSIAYLLPAALTAKKLGIGIGVATKTNTLMDQLVYHELPALDKALEGGLDFVALKGYEHYPCLRKLMAFAAEEPDEQADERYAHGSLAMVATLLSYVLQTEWGDLDSVCIYWRDLPRNRIAASPGDCTRHHCPYNRGCFLHGLRARAKQADIVVTNHALLFRDVVAEGGILPPIRHWIVDEAHAVEEEARKQLSPQMKVSDLLATLRTLSDGHQSILANVRRKAQALAAGDMIAALAAQAQAQAESTETIATSFISFLKDLGDIAESSDYEFVDLWVNEEVRNTGRWGTVVSTGNSLVDRLEKLISQCKDLCGLFDDEGVSGGEALDLKAELTGTVSALSSMREALVLVIGGDSSDYVYSVGICKHPDRALETVSASILDVGQQLAELFYPQTLSVIYTSATIATGESFEHFEHATGLDLLEKGSYKTLRLTSSYDFDRNMKVFVPTDVPAPTEPGYLTALENMLLEVHRAMGGSTLTLFTNRREMEQLYHALSPVFEREGIDLYCQLRGTSMKRVRDDFLADENACLFALRSFWEGFDAPGDTLRCVIIPRLPFARPNDPLSRERELRDSQAWRHHTLPEAVISLKQAAGRLVRSSSDTGYLVLADSRLISRRYGKVFLQALPSKSIEMSDTAAICEEITTLES